MSKIQTFIQNIEDGIVNLTTLRIETVMGDLKVNDEGKIDFSAGQNIQGVVSDIQLVSGDVKTQITEEFYKKYPELVQFHQSRELKGHEIIQGNIDALKAIIDTFSEFLEKRKKINNEQD